MSCEFLDGTNDFNTMLTFLSEEHFAEWKPSFIEDNPCIGLINAFENDCNCCHVRL